MRTTDLFMSQGHQAVTLPGDLNFPGQTEVAIWRDGDKIILEPVSEDWARVMRYCEFLPFSGLTQSREHMH